MKRFLILGPCLVVLGLALFWLLSGDDQRRDGEPGATEGRETKPTDELEGPSDDGADAVSRDTPDSSEEPATEGPGEGTASAEKPLFVRVVDMLERPVEGALVRIAVASDTPVDALERQGQPFFEGTSDREGLARVDAVPNGPVHLFVRAEGFAWFEDVRRVAPIERPADFATVRLQAGLELSGVVVDASGTPVADAELAHVFGNPRVPASDRRPAGRTDADGRFRLTSLAPGPWEVRVSSAEHPPALFSGNDHVPASGLVWTLSAAATIEGRVEGLADAYRANAMVRATPSTNRILATEGTPVRTTRLAKNGTFRLSGLTRGQAYDVVLVPRNGSRQRLSTIVTTRAPDRDVLLSYVEVTTLRFQVAFTDGSAPPAEIVPRLRLGDEFVRGLESEPHETQDGRVVLDDLVVDVDSSRGTLHVTGVGLSPTAPKAFQIGPGEDLDLGLIELERKRTVTLDVREAGTDRPLEGVQLSLCHEDGAPLEATGVHFGETDDAGRTTVDLPVISRVGLRVYRERRLIHSALVQTVELLDGQHAVLVEPTASLNLLISSNGGEPVEGIGVSGLAGVPPLVSDPDGRLLLEDLPAGEFELTPIKGALSVGAPRVVTLESGEVTEEAWTIDSLVRLEGTVTSLGAPVLGARLWIVRNGEFVEQGGEKHALESAKSAALELASTNSQGAFVFDALPKGACEVWVEHPERALVHREPVTLANDRTRLDVELPSEGVDGRVVDEAGRGVRGARLDLIAEAWSESLDADWHRLLFAIEQGMRPMASADADGRFVLAGLDLKSAAMDSAFLVVSAPRFVTRTLSVTDLAESPEIRLERGGSIEVRLVDPEGRLERGARTLVRLARDTVRTLADSRALLALSGRAEFNGLAPGRYRVRGEGGEVTVDLEAGARQVVDLRSR